MPDDLRDPSGKANCQHENLPEVPFDAEEAMKLSAPEVQKRWPRLELTCPDCKLTITACYASFEHYTAGDW